MILRPQDTVHVHRLPPGGAEFVLELRGGSSLGESANTTLATCPAFDMATNLSIMVASSVLTGILNTCQEGFIR